MRGAARVHVRMIVEKYPIPPGVLADLESRAKSIAPFTTGQFEDAIKAYANNRGDQALWKRAMRIADRLTTKWKTEGKIVKSNATGRAVWAWKAGSK